MGNFDLYRKKMYNDDRCRMKHESNFILEGTSSTTILSLRLNRNKNAALIFNEKEGPDTAIVFTYKEQASWDELNTSDYFKWNNKIFFVYEQNNIVREVTYKKQKAYECNVNVDTNNYTYYGYYVSSLSKYVDTSLQKNLNITDNDKPIVIMPKQAWMAIGQKLTINNIPYKVIDMDLVTNNGVAYLSLDRDFSSKQDDVIEQVDINSLKAGIELTREIKFGYFQTNPQVNITKKTATMVTYIIPYGINSIEIITKDENSIEIRNTYKVVI